MLVAVIAIAAVVAVVGFVVLRRKPAGPNPFEQDHRRPTAPLVTDEKARDKVLKNGYTASKIPQDLDAIVIGSGIGGLSVASLLAKTGKRVLVLEQHDQIGGCCHTFHDSQNGFRFEFDTGVHYCGELGPSNRTLTKFLFDTITDGQLTWSPLENEYDRVVLGKPGTPEHFEFGVVAGRDQLKAALKEKFPKEHAAIDKYFQLLSKTRKEMMGFLSLKFMPAWLGRLVARTGLIHWMTDYFRMASRSVADVLSELTEDRNLRATLAYCFGDYGTLPSEAPFTMHAILVSHFLYGVAYPRGGASEIAFHIAPSIERAGGACLVRARVDKVVLDEATGRAVGVKMSKDGREIRVKAGGQVISDAGYYNTFGGEGAEGLLPPSADANPGIQRIRELPVRNGFGCMSVYVGLKGSSKDLGLKATNIWAFENGNDLEGAAHAFMDRTLDEVREDPRVPLIFVSFPSCKDPTWPDRFPDRCTCEIITLAPWEWFATWENERLKHRGEDYESLKNALGESMWAQVCTIFPQLKDKVVFWEVGTPVTNKYYLNAVGGVAYGLDANLSRFSPLATVELRPTTPIPGLYMTGQDVLSCGIAGALNGGLLCAAEILGRNLLMDMIEAKNRFGMGSKKAD